MTFPEPNRHQRKVRRKFTRGIHRLFGRLFSNDIEYYRLVEGVKDDLYDEWKEPPLYAEPIRLTGSVNRTPQAGDTVPEEQRYDAQFVVTLQSCRNAELEVEEREKHREIRQGFICYQGIAFEIIRIDPRTFLADYCVTFSFNCRELKVFPNGAIHDNENREMEAGGSPT